MQEQKFQESPKLGQVSLQKLFYDHFAQLQHPKMTRRGQRQIRSKPSGQTRALTTRSNYLFRRTPVRESEKIHLMSSYYRYGSLQEQSLWKIWENHFDTSRKQDILLLAL